MLSVLRSGLIFLMSVFLFLAIQPCLPLAGAQEPAEESILDRYGLSLNFGYTYDPDEDIRFLLASGFALYDYDKVWPHRAPEALRFKVEASAGSTVNPQIRFMASAGILALYYLDGLSSYRLRPYVEGGIGIIYTDFQVEGQGLRLNFNPQLGLGSEFRVGAGPPFFATVRLHHISNAGLNEDNRGLNSIVFMLGRFF